MYIVKNEFKVLLTTDHLDMAEDFACNYFNRFDEFVEVVDTVNKKVITSFARDEILN